MSIEKDKPEHPKHPGTPMYPRGHPIMCRAPRNRHIPLAIVLWPSVATVV